MAHIAFLVDWEKFQTELKATRSYEQTLDHFTYESGPEDLDDMENSTFHLIWTWIRDHLDVPWQNAFENIFSFELNPAIQLEKEQGYEPYPRFWISKTCSPEEVKFHLKAWRDIEYKPLLRRIPKKYRARYIGMALYAKE